MKINWGEYSRLIEMNNTGGICVQTPKPYVQLLTNGEHSGQHGFSGAPSTEFSWEKIPYAPLKSP